MRALGVAITFACVSMVSGCGDQCQADEAHCEGQQIRTCDTTDDIYADWRGLGENCGTGSCIDLTVGGLREAVCSTSGQADPQCEASAAPVFCNTAGQRVSCNGVYSMIEDCTAEGQFCIDADHDGVFCSVGAAPDPACVQDGPDCDGDNVVDCYAGYVVGRVTCDPAMACLTSTVTWNVSGYSFTSDYAYCASATSCAGPDQASCSKDGRINGCIAGVAVAMSCGASLKCDEADTPWGTTEAVCRTR